MQHRTLRYSQLLKFVTPHRNTLIAVVLLLLAGTAVTLVTPLIAARLTAILMGGPDAGEMGISTIMLAWLGLMVVRALLGLGSRYLVGNTSVLMSAELRSRIFEHMQFLPLGYFHDRKQGDILSLLSSDSEEISTFVTDTLVQALPLLLMLIAAFLIMTWLNPFIGLLAFLLMPAYYAAMKLIGRRLRPLSSDWVKSWSHMVALVHENLALMPVVKAFVREPVESLRFRERNEGLVRISRKQILFSSLLTSVIALMASCGSLLLLWVGIQQLEAGRVSPPELVALLFYAFLLLSPLSGLANVYGEIMRARGSAERLLDFFAEQPEPSSRTGGVVQKLDGRIEFQDLTFAYPNNPPVFRNFSLTIEGGETIALTGLNGAGKSTLVHLLMRFMELDDGRIRIGGTDIVEMDLGSLRRQIGLVAQHALLLNGTVAENIAYGHPYAGLEEIKKAAKAALADEFIARLPESYETVIGDQGVKLSGGQRQRLSLARTLLNDPPILILDETTAMFDPKAEASFVNQGSQLLKQRTVILITHRPESLALADRIVEIMPVTTLQKAETG